VPRAATEEVIGEVDDREARERERERHEEERVVRHLRGLLNRSSNSTTSASTPSAGMDAASRRRTRSNSQTLGDSLDLVGGSSRGDTMAGLRNRFAKYVAVRRTRRRDNSSTGSSPPTTEPDSTSR
jgi:hypothetical protein